MDSLSAVPDATGSVPGASFGEIPVEARRLDRGMGFAVAWRTVFRPEDAGCFGRVADRAAAGNMALLGRPLSAAEYAERARLRNAIAYGALFTAGRHLQHGDAAQPGRNMELFTNCATAIASFATFYLLLNGSGVGRSYDDELIAVDWAETPDIRLHLDGAHPDFPQTRADVFRLGVEFALLPASLTPAEFTVAEESRLRSRGRRAGTLGTEPAGRPYPVGRGPDRRRPPRCAHGHEILARSGDPPLHSHENRGRAVDCQQLGDGRCGVLGRCARTTRRRDRRRRWSAMPGPCSRRRRAAPGATASRGSSTATFWRITAPERPGASRVYDDGRDLRSARDQVDHAAGLLTELSYRARAARFPVTTNPCGEIVLHVSGGYCVVADFAPLLACPMEPEQLVPGAVPEAIAAEWDRRIEDSVRLGVRFLMRVNLMDGLYAEEVRRTNRMGIGPTGLHEWAWVRFGLSFDALLDERRSAPFWAMLDRLSSVAKAEGAHYAAELGLAVPVTVTTIKPAGTISKLFGLTEGAHLPARRQYLRWVQFKGTKDTAGRWSADADPLLGQYQASGYPVRTLRSFPGMSIVGFPTLPRIQRLGMGDGLLTASEASPAQHYAWLRLLERHWIGASQGNQVSYTLKIDTERHGLGAYRAIVREHQPGVRCCSVLRTRPDHALGYEYLPEQEVSPEEFRSLTAGIDDRGPREAIDDAHLQCTSGACPI